MYQTHYLPTIGSTNTYLLAALQEQDLPDGFTVYTFDQTAGRGQQGNHWESEKDQNLLFSTYFNLTDLPIERQFALSMFTSLAIKDVLESYTEGIHIKWPNDIYWHDKKLTGILIECTLQDGHIAQAVVGAGINLNQQHFYSDAPNPVSLRQIIGQEVDKHVVLEQLIGRFEAYRPWLNQPEMLHEKYMSALYRRDNFYPYEADGIIFEAKIIDVAQNGVITLQWRDQSIHTYCFKQLKYILPCEEK